MSIAVIPSQTKCLEGTTDVNGTVPKLPNHQHCAFTAGEVCFSEVGCFSDLPPWGGTTQRPVSVLPWAPEQIGTRFLLFTQSNRYYQASSFKSKLEVILGNKNSVYKVRQLAVVCNVSC